MRKWILCWCLAAGAAVPLHAAAAQASACNGKPATTTGEYGTGGDDVFVGTEGDDTYHDSGGNDTICGLGGDDVLVGGLGDDYLDGGAGNDRLYGCDPSHNRSDVFICHSRTDADTLLGGAGDDYLSGDIDIDSLDGDDGYDAVDGGEEGDSCTRGEQYARCETMDPPEAPAECSDGLDNDGDGHADAEDGGCSRPSDPTEDLADDPECFNGNDDDGDGYRDYPEDYGCTSFDQDDELWCVGLCPMTYLGAGYDDEADEFHGFLEERSECANGREVLVRRMTRSGPRTVARTLTTGRGGWRTPWTGRPGRYFAVARAFTYSTGADEPVCHRLISRRFRVSR